MLGRKLEQPRGRFALTNGRVVLPQEIVTGKAVIVEGGKILGIADAGSLDTSTGKIDVGGRYIAPELIDIHTQGALAHTFNEPTAEAFASITEENAKHGVTSLWRQYPRLPSLTWWNVWSSAVNGCTSHTRDLKCWACT